MPRQLHLTLELPDEVVKHLPDKELAAKAKEELESELKLPFPRSQRDVASISFVYR